MQLFAEQSIVIEAGPEKVWDVLTQSSFTKDWVGDFQPVFAHLESDWKVGSKVLWLTQDGKTLVDGKVSASEPYRKLSFTVHDVSGDFNDVLSDKDGIFYTLTEHNGGAKLSVKQGDFSKVGAKAQDFCEATDKSWQSALLAIKSLAEQQ
jgi:uncharacterized protein YndB with AHSA1/START domain